MLRDTRTGYTSAARKLGRASQPSSRLSKLSAVSQNQPLMVEIKGFKTSHFLEQKTAPLDCWDAGQMGHVERPQSEPAATIQSLHDRGWSRRRIAGELGINRETVGRYLLLAKPAISTTADSPATI